MMKSKPTIQDELLIAGMNLGILKTYMTISHPILDLSWDDDDDFIVDYLNNCLRAWAAWDSLAQKFLILINANQQNHVIKGGNEDGNNVRLG